MDGLVLYNQIGYIHTDISSVDNGAQHFDNDTDDAWEFAVGFRYTF